MTTLTERGRTLAQGTHSRTLRYLPVSAAVIDLVIITAVVALSAALRRELDVFVNPADLSSELGMLAPAIAMAWLAVIALLGGYRWDVFGSSTEEYRRVLNSSLLTAGVLGVVCFLAKYSLSRGFFMLIFALGVPGLLVGRFVLRRFIHSARRRGVFLQRAVIVGSRAHVDEIGVVLRRESWLGYDVLGAVTPPHETEDETPTGLPVLGNAEDVRSIAAIAEADVIFFAGGGLSSSQQLREIIWQLEHDALQVVVAPTVSEISSERVTIRPVAGMPLLHIDPPRWAHAARFGKRLFDLAGALSILTLASVVMLFCALRIRLHDRGPVLFRQTRIGRDGVEFSCLKFRTMVVDAESRLVALHNEETLNGSLFKMKGDPRITAPGRWLRRFSFDELPQLFNVVRGDMSLVGPRPPLPAEVLSYEQRTSRRLRVRPGMTGLWQVSGRSDLSFEEAVRLDLYYVDNWSMLQDLSILFRTLGAVISSRGAY